MNEKDQQSKINRLQHSEIIPLCFGDQANPKDSLNIERLVFVICTDDNLLHFTAMLITAPLRVSQRSRAASQPGGEM